MFGHHRACSWLLASVLALALGPPGCTKSSDEPAEGSAAAPEAADQAPQAAAPAAPGEEAPAEAEAAPPARAALGQPAPDFTLTDLDGKQHALASLRGKTVVLEWFNPGCPFIQYAHGEGPLKDAAKLPGAGRDDVVWLAINSGASGKQGHGKEVNAKAHADWSMSYPLLIDESGDVGRLYEAKTTPHMYIIDQQGTLVYRGGLDNAPVGKLKGDAPVNYVQAALDDLAAGRPVQTPESQPYGCSVKYES